MDHSPRIETNHNVYLLGAGFSWGAGMPLVKEFLNKMRDSVDWLRSENREDESKAVQSIFEFRLRAAAGAYRAQINIENIEESL